MPRPSNQKSNRIVIEGKFEEENIKIRAFKGICSRNNRPYREEILEAINTFLRVHNWPPGNSQTQLKRFGAQRKILQNCEYPNCVKTAEYKCYPKGPYAKPIVFYCKTHKDSHEDNRLITKYEKL